MDRSVTLHIPPIPLDYLFIDDATAASAGNLDYDAATDFYAIDPNKAGFKHLTPEDRLKVKVSYFTFPGDAVANGVSVGFEVSGGENHGLPVRYNPIWSSNGSGRDPNAPAITVSLLLNPNSVAFKNLNRLSESTGMLRIMTSETGDGIFGFKPETLDFFVQDDGLMFVDLHHLTSIGLDAEQTTDDPDEPDEPEEPDTTDGQTSGNGGDGESNSSCFIGATAAETHTGSSCLKVLLSVLGLFVLIAGFGENGLNRKR